jgi:hypothetical protein
LYVTAALAICLGLRATSRLAARQAIELRIQPARGELLAALDLLPAFPPLRILWRLGDGLGAGFSLGDFGAFTFLGRI